ncbi:MAG: translation initiation factor 2 [Phyllobacteriaceae bacterium]|nr:translation initiation factor 2 [Phyllobacteriaceae bacterium]
MRRLLVISCVLLAGCASAIRGTTEKVEIVAYPADARITTTLGQTCATSPCVLEVARKEKFTVNVEKDGYKPGSVFVDTKMSAAGGAGLAGNIVAGGVIGMGVDAATGATLDHYPNPVMVTLEPIDAANPATPAQPKPVVPDVPAKPDKKAPSSEFKGS